MTSKLMAPILIIMLIVFSIIVVGLAVLSSGIIQTVAFAQTLEADDASSTSSQDSSSDDNVLDNENDFGVDGTAIGHDNEADEGAANVGVQEQDTTQEQDQEQDAVNTNVDSDVQIGVQRPPPQPQPPGPEEPPTTGPTLRITELNCDRLPEYLEARWRAESLPRDIEGFVLFLEFSDSNRREPVGGGASHSPTIGEIGHVEGGFLTPANGDTGPYTLFFYEDNNLDTIPDEGGLRLTTTFTCE